MKLITKNHLLIFLIAFAVPLGYSFSWYVCKWCGLPWRTKYNSPFFIFISGSLPWSWSVFYYPFKLRAFFGHAAGDILNLIIICAGFALNCTIIIVIVKKLLPKIHKKDKDSLGNTKLA